uniref:Uncharacterized protein n=1 Tax=Anguilla anguilla TaxID=7936 RepID=A0A0E9PR72_ANGAN
MKSANNPPYYTKIGETIALYNYVCSGRCLCDCI